MESVCLDQYIMFLNDTNIDYEGIIIIIENVVNLAAMIMGHCKYFYMQKVIHVVIKTKANLKYTLTQVFSISGLNLILYYVN